MVLGAKLESNIIKVFSKLNDSVIPNFAKHVVC